MTQKLSSHHPHPTLYQTFVEACRTIRSKRTRPNHQQSERLLRFEPLEQRCVLSASGLDIAAEPQSETQPETVYVTSEFQSESPDAIFAAATERSSNISEVAVRVNGHVQYLDPSHNVLNLAAGDSIEILEIGIQSNHTSGIFAVEGYVNKINDLTSASLVDYNDGRFSARADNFAATGSNGSVAGLQGEWIVQEGWDRLTLNLMQYSENSIDVADRLFIQMEVGESDLAFDTSVFTELSKSVAQVGETFDIPAVWFNQGNGQNHTYAEVDIYHSSDTSTIVWAGAIAGNPSGEQFIEGSFENNHPNSGFTKHWTPNESGEYILKFYIDPESKITESNEVNNEFEVRLNANQGPVANSDSFETNVDENLDRLDLLANDSDPDGDDVRVSEISQPKSGKVTINEDGTVNYEPNAGFQGTDSFDYTITDGEFQSESATVSVDVQPTGFFVKPLTRTAEDNAADLSIDLDFEKFDGVKISGIPDGAELSHGEQLAKGTYYVYQADINKLSIQPAEHSDEDFVVTVTPTQQEMVYHNLSQTINVQIDAIVDGAHIDIQNFGIVTGNHGRFPMRTHFEDLDGSEQHQLTLHNVPTFVSFTTGHADGNDWVLSMEDLESVEIVADRVSDTSDWNSYYYHKYKSFEVSYTVDSFEQSNDDSRSKSSKFTFYAFQR